MAVVGYNLAPEASLNQMVSEIKSAVKYINTRFPKSKLFLCGHSVTKSDECQAGVQFVKYEYDYRPNCILLGPITIINQNEYIFQRQPKFEV